jgi:hypothetical protein
VRGSRTVPAGTGAGRRVRAAAAAPAAPAGLAMVRFTCVLISSMMRLHALLPTTC